MWLLLAWPLAWRARRRGRFSAGWIYRVAVASAFVAVVTFFVLFAYPFMVCVPVGMLSAAAIVHLLLRPAATSVS